MAKNRWRGWALLAVLATGAVRADLVYFARGGRAQLATNPAPDGGLSLDTPYGPVEFPRADFRKVVPDRSPELDWPRRCTSCRAGGSGGRFAAAWWALENGLTERAEAMLREAHAADPSHPATERMIDTLGRLDRRCDDPDLGPLQKAIGPAFATTRGPHVLLLHQHGEAESGERHALLESVVRTFYLVFSAWGFDLDAPPRRLVLVWFAEHRDYLAFLHSEGSDAFRTTLGYYHPTLNAVITYDVRTGPEQLRAREAIAGQRLELDRRSAGDEGGRLRRESMRRLLLLEMERRAYEVGTAPHEMVHLLVAESVLAPRHDDWPLWLHEGLAAQFEVVRGG